MSTVTPDPLANVEGEPFDGGRCVWLRLTGASKRSFTVGTDSETLSAIVAHLLGLANDAGLEYQPPAPLEFEADPVPLTSLAFAAGNAKDETFVVLQIGLVRLTLSITAPELAGRLQGLRVETAAEPRRYTH